MPDKPKPVGKPNPKLPMYDLTKGSKASIGTHSDNIAASGSERIPRARQAVQIEAESRLAGRNTARIEDWENNRTNLRNQRPPSRPEATYPRRASLTPRGATSTTAPYPATPRSEAARRTIEKADRILRNIDARSAAKKALKSGLKERVVSAVRSNASKLGAGISKWSPPIATAGAAHTLTRALLEGDTLLRDKAKVMRDKSYTRENYSTEAKARRSRIEGPRR